MNLYTIIVSVWICNSNAKREYYTMTTNTQVRKQYQELIALLESNKNKKISTIMPSILELVTTTHKARTFIKDSDDTTLAIYCYYHKQWELVDVAEYGNKKSSASGLNTMCKEGTSHWTRQQREAKKASATLLTSLADGSLALDDLALKQEEIEAERLIITPREDGHGFDSIDDVLS